VAPRSTATHTAPASRAGRLLALCAAAVALLASAAPALAQQSGGGTVPPPDLVPLNQVPVPEPPSLFQYVKNKSAAIKLGKALFWDMQAGSDGVQACASCHFHAGADNRMKNTVNPGARGGDATFQVRGPNQTLLYGESLEPALREAATASPWTQAEEPRR